MDDQAADFHQRVRKAYLELAAGEPQRVTVVDGRGDVASVEQAVWNAVAVRLGKLHV